MSRRKALGMCRFCYLPAETTIRRHRRAWLDKIAWWDALSVRVCANDVYRAVAYVRTWRGL